MQLISVIIPVFNGKQFIAKAIESVLNQTWPWIEVIVVDDASNDATADFIRETFPLHVNRNQIKIYTFESNKERCFARNFGVSKSQGEYLFFLDYDDMWHPRYVEEVMGVLKNFHIVYSWPRTFINPFDNIQRVSQKKLKSLEKELFSGKIGFPSGMSFQKKAFLGFDVNFILREDWELMLRSYFTGYKMTILDHNRVYIRQHSYQTSRNPKMLHYTLKAFEKYKHRVPPEFKGDFLFHMALTYWKYGQGWQGWNTAIKAIKNNPQLLKERDFYLETLKRGIRFDRFLWHFLKNLKF